MTSENKGERSFWALTFGVLLMGIALMLTQDGNPLHSIGEALAIAATLAITVDKYLKRRLMKELAHDVFHFLIGYDLPAEARDRIREIVTKSTLIRRDCELNYRIETLPGDPEKVRVELTSTFSLDNITSEELFYQFRICTTCASESSRFLRLWCHSQQAEASYDYPASELRLEGPDAEENYWIKGKEIRVPPKNFERNIKFEVGAKHESISQYRHDIEEYGFIYPTLCVRVKIDYPEDEFTVCAVPKPSTRYSNEWVYDRFFVAGEQIAIRWARKAPARRKTDPENLKFPRNVPGAVPVPQGDAA